MDKSELYLVIAVFVVLMVIIVWIGTKMIFDLRKRKRNRETRRQEWLKRMDLHARE